MNRWLVWAPLAVLALLAALFAGWALNHDPTYKPDAMVGRPLQISPLPRLDGGAVSSEQADLRILAGGRPIIVNLFASWCAPCRAEHPQLMALKARGVRIIGIAYKDDPIATRAMLDELGDPFAEILVDRDGQAGLDLGVSGVPESFAVNAEGRIVAKAPGPIIGSTEAERLVAALSSDPAR